MLDNILSNSHTMVYINTFVVDRNLNNLETDCLWMTGLYELYG
jgi:hypothetical protein